MDFVATFPGYTPRIVVEKRPGFSRSNLKRLLKDDPTFPKPITRGGRDYFADEALNAWFKTGGSGNVGHKAKKASKASPVGEVA